MNIIGENSRFKLIQINVQNIVIFDKKIRRIFGSIYYTSTTMTPDEDGNRSTKNWKVQVNSFNNEFHREVIFTDPETYSLRKIKEAILNLSDDKIDEEAHLPTYPKYMITAMNDEGEKLYYLRENHGNCYFYSSTVKLTLFAQEEIDEFLKNDDFLDEISELYDVTIINRKGETVQTLKSKSYSDYITELGSL